VKKQFIFFSLILFGFWIILSGKFDVWHLLIGLATALTVSWLCRSFLLDLPYLKLFFYAGWLCRELVKANVEVALIVLNPKMPISPRLVTFKKTMDNPVAHTVLANSITLTPGTITVDVEEGVYTVHALTEKAALSLAPLTGEGEMPARVGRLFNE
jgi:multicomponent Na+:H+ antiporter subunit E